MSMRWFERLASRRPPDFEVMGGLDTPYMQRWWVIPRNPVFNIYLHRFWRSDEDEALHDHPWINFTYLLKGYYEEVTADGVRPYVKGSMKLRWASTPHRIVIDPNDAGEVWSLFFTGPIIRQWGFHCPKGWVHWKVFTNGKKGTKGTGCA